MELRDYEALKLIQYLDMNQEFTMAIREQLTRITALSLKRMPVKRLPDNIGLLSGLKELNLSQSEITALPESIGQLTWLQGLFLEGTGIAELPESIRHLHILESLDLSNTRITILPEWIGELPKLQQLYVRGLTLSGIPKSLGMRYSFVEKTRNSNLKKYGIDIANTSILGQNKFVFINNPNLVSYFYRHDELKIRRECRVIFLGDGASGKSYTIKRFRNGGKKETGNNLYTTSETPGVEILDYEAEKGNDAFTIHFWDFGGQELLHSMHRCFLTEDCCYVVTVKTRETSADERARYWLRNVRAFAPNSPILLYVNCWENDDGRRSVDERRLRNDFPQIRNVIYCSAKLAGEAVFRENVMKPILGLAAASPGITRQVPLSWDSVREAIEREGKQNNYLTREQYHALCAVYDIEDEQAPGILSYFNSLGVCFSYHMGEDRKELADYKLLSPVWLTNAIYAIIEEGSTYATKGCIPREAIAQMLVNEAPKELRGEQYRRTAPEKRYRRNECPFIVDIAKAHDLCYEVDENTLFFPALCGANSPESALSDPPGFGRHAVYLLCYEYLPDNVLHQLMVRCRRNGLRVDECWLKGAIFGVWNQHKIYMSMAEDRKLRIDIYSKDEHRAYEVFWFLLRQIEEINQGLNLLGVKESIMDGEDIYSVLSLRNAAEKDITVIGNESGVERSAKELLGEFFEDVFLANMQVENGRIVIPVRLREFHEREKSDRFLREALYEAYKGICPYCGELIKPFESMEVDHILPAKYGNQEHPELEQYENYLKALHFDLEKPDYIENYFPSHSSCNKRKSNRVNEFSLPYWHDHAAKRAPRVLSLIEKYKKEQNERREARK